MKHHLGGTFKDTGMRMQCPNDIRKLMEMHEKKNEDDETSSWSAKCSLDSFAARDVVSGEKAEKR